MDSANSLTDANARGNYVFTGLYSSGGSAAVRADRPSTSNRDTGFAADRPSRIMPSASVATTSALVGPRTMPQIFLSRAR